MALKIDTNQSVTAFHINDGAVLFPYPVDAQHAVSHHPLEWSALPWTRHDADAARAKLKERYDAAVADAKAQNLPAPPPLPPPPEPLTPEDQAALDEHNKMVAEAAKRLAAYHEKKAKEKAEADQAGMDEAIVSSVPPRPDPAARRPLSPAQLRKASATLTPQEEADLKLASDKAEHDKLANAAVGGAKLTT